MQPTVRRLGVGVQSGCANPGSDRLHLTFGWGSAGWNNGNLMSQAIAAPGFSQTQYYEYDEVNRLAIAVEGATVPMNKTCPATASWCREYDYDHFGNRWIGYSNRSLHMATPTSAGAFSATTNRLSAATYDTAGNLTAHPYITSGGGSIAYNANNLAASFTATGVSVATAYDANGKRVVKTVNGSSTVYVYTVTGALAAEYQTATVTTRAGTYYRTTDHLGSTRDVTDKSSMPQVVQRRDFMPFGEEIPADSSHGNRHTVSDYGTATYNAVSGVTQQFTGQHRDSETGLDYFWARNYFPPLGSFLSVDPAGVGARSEEPQSWNAFAYVGGRPLSFTDPDGRSRRASTSSSSSGILRPGGLGSEEIERRDPESVPNLLPSLDPGPIAGSGTYPVVWGFGYTITVIVDIGSGRACGFVGPSWGAGVFLRILRRGSLGPNLPAATTTAGVQIGPFGTHGTMVGTGPVTRRDNEGFGLEGGISVSIGGCT